jgi:hypothetical protein
MLMGGHKNTVVYVRRLGDIDILGSYLILLWRGRYSPSCDAIHVMERSIKEDFGETGMRQHWKDLIECLDHALWQLDYKLDESFPGNTIFQAGKRRYTRLKDKLLEVDKQ